MARMLAISSFLAHGQVGLGATVPVLQAMGHEVIQLPAVILSNHPGHPRVAGQPVMPDRLVAMLDALQANGWLAGLGAVLTGYLPSAEHVAFAARAVETVRELSPGAVYVCDPILGDDPKGLYIDAGAAAAIREHLVARADVITPNRFELSWLTGCAVDDVAGCQAAAGTLAGPAVVATSIPAGQDARGRLLIGNVLANRSGVSCLAAPRRAAVPHGTGDTFTALLTGHLLKGEPLSDAFARSHRQLEGIVAASAGRQHLDLSLLTSLANLT